MADLPSAEHDIRPVHRALHVVRRRHSWSAPSKDLPASRITQVTSADDLPK
jgi:hypothetical protein